MPTRISRAGPSSMAAVGNVFGDQWRIKRTYRSPFRDGPREDDRCPLSEISTLQSALSTSRPARLPPPRRRLRGVFDTSQAYSLDSAPLRRLHAKIVYSHHRWPAQHILARRQRSFWRNYDYGFGYAFDIDRLHSFWR